MTSAQAQPVDPELQKVYDDICRPRMLICQHAAARPVSKLSRMPALKCDTELDQQCKVISEKYHAAAGANAKAIEDATRARVKSMFEAVK